MNAKSLVSAMAIALAVPVLAVAQPAIKREPVQATGIVAGDALYKAYCAVCHGADGRGGGPAARALKDPIPDLTSLAARNKGRFSASDIEASITGQGKPMAAAHGAPDMPVWGPIFRDLSSDPALRTLRIANLVKHLESMQVK